MTTFDVIDAMIYSHPAWQNSFFERAKDGLPLKILRRVCPEYYCFTASFPKILAQLIARLDDGTRFHLVSILYSELGSGTESQAHANLFRRLCRDLGIPSEALHSGPKLGATSDLINGLSALYCDAQILQSLGAQYALEFQADNMLRSFRRGFAALEGSSGQGAAEGMEFFVVHEKEEPRHISAMKQALIRDLADEEGLQLVTAGARQCLDLFGRFWLEFTHLSEN